MRNASGPAQGKMSGNEKKKREKEHIRPFLHKPCNQEVSSYWTFHVIVIVQNNGKEMCKKVCCTCKVVFVVIIVFSPFPLPSPLSITRVYIQFEQTISVTENFAFNPAEIYILSIDTELPPNSMTTLNLPILQDRLINQMFDKCDFSGYYINRRGQAKN